MSTSNRMSLRTPLCIAAASFAACVLFWLCWGLYLYWNDSRLINFLAAWIPLVISILLAFVPEHKMKSRWKQIAWRAAVVLVGFLWSGVLWHQQVVGDRAKKQEQEKILHDAVNESNTHSDLQINAVRSDVREVKGDVRDIKNDVKSVESDVSEAISKSTSAINESIGKVGKPDPPELATLLFSVFPTGSEYPILSSTSSQDKDGSYPVEFTVRNMSGVAAEEIDIWVLICDVCSFTTEPTGFDKPQGINERVRHKILPQLNSGVSLEKTKISVKISPVAGISSFEVGLRYSCKTCGKMKSDTQKIMILMKPDSTLAINSTEK